MTDSYWACEPCGARLIMALVGGKRKMLDWPRADDGSFAVHQTASGTWMGRELVQGETPLPYEHRHHEHFTTSPQCRPPSPDQRQAAAEAADQIGTWRKAESAHSRAQRQQRGKRPAAQTYLGFRKNP